MRLTIATPLYPPEPGGPATYAKILEEGLPGHDIEVALVKFSEVRHLPKGIRHIRYAWNVWKEARRSNLVLALDPVSVGLPARIAAFMAARPFVVKVVGDFAWEQGRQRFNVSLPLDEFVRTRHVPLQVAVLRLIEQCVARTARRVIVPSQYLQRVVETWGVRAVRIDVIENAKPLETPGVLPDAVAALGRPRIVTAGRLVPWKGMPGVIAAMREVRARVPDAQLIVVGDGPDRDMLERSAALRLRDGYIFTGALAHADALAVISDADIFVLNSSYEGLSHILLEALELGKAIIATKAGGNPEVIEDGVSGYGIPVGDDAALAERILTLIEHPEEKTRLESGARVAAERFTPERMLAATATLLTSLV